MHTQLLKTQCTAHMRTEIYIIVFIYHRVVAGDCIVPGRVVVTVHSQGEQVRTA